MPQNQINDIVDFLNELLEDNTVPKNLKAKIEMIRSILESKDDISIKVDRAVLELEEIQNDSNLQPYLRTQIWNVVSMLEGI